VSGATTGRIAERRVGRRASAACCTSRDCPSVLMSVQVCWLDQWTLTTARSALSSRDRIITDLVSFEVIDNRTGKTEVLSGQQCLGFFLGGRPGN